MDDIIPVSILGKYKVCDTSLLYKRKNVKHKNKKYIL